MRVTLLKLLQGLTEAVDFPGPVYEFGAYRVPGQEHLPFVHSYFPGQPFVGCDMRSGPGVDEIQDLHALSLPDESVGTALLFDTIEHVRTPWQALAEVHRCLKPGGIVIMTSVWYFPIHAYPDDYWRFTSSAFQTLLKDFQPVSIDMCGLARLPHTVFGIASKGPLEPQTQKKIQDVVAAWKRRGARSWKEAVIEITPPIVLIPAYDLFLKAMRVLHPRRHAEAAHPETAPPGVDPLKTADPEREPSG